MIPTVTGPIEKETLGVTLAHEHLAWDYIDSWNLYFHKQYDEEKVENLYNKLLPIFKSLYQLGCRTIAEASPPRGGQNLLLMQRISEKSGIKIIANTGLPFKRYVYEVHKKFDVKELAERWIEDFEKGLDVINNIVIRPGQIKLLLGDGENGSLSEIDGKLLKAAIIASKATGMPIHCHLFKAMAAEEAIDILEKENFDFSKFLWAHAGKEGNFDVIEKAFLKGIWLGFDQIRPENYDHFCTLIKEALHRGFKDKLILSQDYDFYDEATKSKNSQTSVSFFTQFTKYCEEHGIPERTIMDIITNNPANFFDIKKPYDQYDHNGFE